MIDYRERKSVSPNRPRSRGGGGKSMLFIVFIVALCAYGAGVATGFLGSWYLRSKSEAAARRAALAATPQTAPGQQSPPAAGKVPDPPLTFYETLPKGKVLLGTGLNPAKQEGEPGQPNSAPPAVPNLQPPPQPATAVAPGGDAAQAKPVPQGAKPATAGQPALAKAPASQTAPAQSDAKGRYVVQVASYQNRDEADSMRKKLAAAGLPAYISESVVTGKGTWYRVRIGKQLEQKTAAEFAAKAGRGAIVILE
jgi:cell division protein FtsN